MSNETPVISVEDAIANPHTVVVEWDSVCGWMLHYIGSQVSTFISQADALRIVEAAAASSETGY